MSNEMLYFPIQDQNTLNDLFDKEEMKFIKGVIDSVFMNISEFLVRDDEDDIFFTENDFISASQANFCTYVQDDIEETVKEAFEFIESDFLNSVFIVLFQLDKKVQVEFLNGLTYLIEQRSECRKVLSGMELLEFFLRIYQHYRD